MTAWLRKNAHNFYTPAVIAVVCILAYGLQIPQLGYYLDDWIILNADNLGGAERVFEYAFLGNRPLVFWIWVIGFKIFGANPLAWQIWALLWRWLTVVILWVVCRRIWPNARRQVALAAFLFAVYPLFKQQASALTYSFHWFSFFLWGLSVYWMILAVHRPGRWSLWMGLSILAAAVQLFSQEFFVGLELLRPLILWLASASIPTDNKKRARLTALNWAPFLLLFSGYFVWRVRFMPTPGADRNVPDLLFNLVSAPIQALPRWIEMLLQDTAQAVLGTWYETYRPDLFTFSPISNIAAWAAALLAFAISLAFFWREGKFSQPVQQAPQSERWYKSAIPFGFLAMTLGFLPGWTIGRHISDPSGIYNDRFGLAAMFGAALLLVGVVDLLIKTGAYRLALVCLLIGLATGQNFRYQTSYRWSWEKQRRLFWQMKWRAPDLAKPTAIYGEGALVSHLGGWAYTSALVQMYGQNGDSHFMQQWYFDLSKIDISALGKDEPLTAQSNFMRYRGSAANSLVIAFASEEPHCLWVLSETDRANPYLSDLLAQAAPYSNLDQILAAPDSPLRADIFGREPARDWCYYFEKGDLARQRQDWRQAAGLWDAAVQQGLRPRVGVEYSPFIEGFAHLGEWDSAVELTRKASYPKYEMRAYLCGAWRRIADSTPASPEKQTTLQAVIDEFECQDEFRH